MEEGPRKRYVFLVPETGVPVVKPVWTPLGVQIGWWPAKKKQKSNNGSLPIRCRARANCCHGSRRSRWCVNGACYTLHAALMQRRRHQPHPRLCCFAIVARRNSVSLRRLPALVVCLPPLLSALKATIQMNLQRICLRGEQLHALVPPCLGLLTWFTAGCPVCIPAVV